MKIGIIRCQDQSSVCSGDNCFPALFARKGRFARYSRDEPLELVGFDTCGGCARNNRADKIVERALHLKKLGAQSIHISWCIYLWCPFKDLYVKELREKVGLPIIEGTHLLPRTPPVNIARRQQPLNVAPPDAYSDEGQ